MVETTITKRSSKTDHDKPNKLPQKSNDLQKNGKHKAKETERNTSLISWLCGYLKYVALCLLIPPFLNYAALMQESRQLLPSGGVLYDIGGGQKMLLYCLGNGAPTVILEAPTGMSSDVWATVHPQLAKLSRVCVYDRAGLGFSERPFKNDSEDETMKSRNRWELFTVERMVDDLHRLITYSSVQPRPLVLVGSELGALVARFYTNLYTSDVSDLVLIDPLVENLFTQDDGIWSHFWFGHLIPSFQGLQLAAAAGIARLLLLLRLTDTPISGPEVNEDVLMRQKYLMCNPRHLSSVVDEHHFINESFQQISLMKKVQPFPSNVSVTVITGNYYDEQLPSALNKAWAKSQEHLISSTHPGSTHIVINDADHRMIYRKPSAISDTIRRIIRQRKSKLK